MAARIGSLADAGQVLASAETVAGWRRHREPWQVNVLAESAALAAIADSEHARRSFLTTRHLTEYLALLIHVCSAR